MKRNRVIFEKMIKVIDSTPAENKNTLDRYLSLANKQLHQACDDFKDNTFSIIGASMAIKRRYEQRHGSFRERPHHIQV